MENRKYKYTQQIKTLMEGMIALPETNEKEDAIWRSLLEAVTQLCHMHQDEQSTEPVQQQAPVEQQLMNNFNLAKQQGGAY